jgi:anti-sigma-K factor RskA
MNEPLTPETIELLAAGYVVDNLDRVEGEAFKQLLAENPAVMADVQQLQTTLDQVVYALNSVEPPPHLQSAILTSAVNSLQPPQRNRFRLSFTTIAGSVAALLILYLGVDNYHLRQDHRLAQDINVLLQQPQTQLFALKSVNSTNTATGSFVVNLEQRQGILVMQNLATPPSNKVYRLWAIADGEKIPCGTLNTNVQGKVLEKFWMPADFYDTGISGLFVTLESSESGRFPTGPIVIQSATSAKI